MGYNDDKITCVFYTKIGACRHGEKCARRHIKPTSSYTILLPNLYQNPRLNKNYNEELNPAQVQEYFDNFYKDIFVKFASIGEVDSLVVCENENNHLNGNVYVRFTQKDPAHNAVRLLNHEWYAGRPVHSELSPVESFQDANCREYEVGTCARGDHCNFMHIRSPSSHIRDTLFKIQEKTLLTNALRKLKQEEQEEKEEKVSSQKLSSDPSVTPENTMFYSTSPEMVEKLFASQM